jgi:FkbH-like protein
MTLLSSFTVDCMTPYLGVALRRNGVVADIGVAPFGQIMQQCLDPNSETAVRKPDVMVVWPRLEDLWAGMKAPLDDPPVSYVEALTDTAAAAVSAATTWGVTLVFVLPAIPEVRPLGVGDAGNPRGVFATATAAREQARARLAEGGALVADAEETVRRLGSASVIDWRRAAVARIPYREEVFAAVAERVERLVRLARKGAKKVVALDGDNTLWGGIVGEDGPAGVDLLDNGPGEAYREFQRYILELRRTGLLITVASKNNEPEFWEAFRRPEMVLACEDLAAWRINWNPKSVSVAEIAAELNLDTSSVALIDDSPVERAEVRVVLPDTEVLEMPSDPADWFEAVAMSGSLDRLPPTAVDRNRAVFYQQENERRKIRKTVSHDQFLASLVLQIQVAAPSASDVPRAAQLMAKTNQFTLGGHRWSEMEIRSLLDDRRFEVRLISASDRFGDYGVVGMLVLDRQPIGLTIDKDAVLLESFALSCRAMGRQIEAAMVAVAFELSGPQLWVALHEGPRNAPARAFFEALGAQAAATPTRLDRPDWPSHISLHGPGMGRGPTEPPSSEGGR